MRTVRVERTIGAPIGRVFDILTDHAQYKRFRRIRGSELITPGQPDPDGLGAMRGVDIGPLHFEEEVTAFERPTRMDYVIRKVNAPFEHEGGSIRLEESGEGTHVVWTSTFRVPVPGIGRLLEKFWATSLGGGFDRVLTDTDRILDDT